MATQTGRHPRKIQVTRGDSSSQTTIGGETVDKSDNGDKGDSENSES